MEMQNNEKVLEALFKNVPGGIILYRWNGVQLKTLHISECYAREYGTSLVSEGENAGGPDFKRIHPDDVEDYREAILKALNITHEIEYVFRSWNNVQKKYLWTKMNAVSQPQPDGTSLCYCMYSDVTREQEALKREQRLSKCLELMTNDDHVEENLTEVMRLVEHQYEAERVYIFEFDWKNHKMSNTYEHVEDGVSREKDNLQDLPITMINHWMGEFKKGNPVFLDDLEAIKDIPERKEEYDVLSPQGIHQLMVIPIIKNNHLFGYIGVDNPAVHGKDKEFLTSVAHILSQEFFSREQQKKLVELSLRDPLTKLNNRHAYNTKIDHYQANGSKGTGVIFADVNGLKYMNDNFGHREGDKLICLAARVLVKSFSKEMTYRISGDEFVVINEDVEESKFLEKAEEMKQKVCDEYGSIFSIGLKWGSGKVDLISMVTEAEQLMYMNKEIYYQSNPLKKRRDMEEILRR